MQCTQQGVLILLPRPTAPPVPKKRPVSILHSLLPSILSTCQFNPMPKSVPNPSFLSPPLPPFSLTCARTQIPSQFPHFYPHFPPSSSPQVIFKYRSLTMPLCFYPSVSSHGTLNAPSRPLLPDAACLLTHYSFFPSPVCSRDTACVPSYNLPSFALLLT